MTYLDANVFIFAAANVDKKGEDCRTIMQKIKDGTINEAYTSTLTFDEIFWIVKKIKGKEKALDAAKNVLELENLNFIPAGLGVIWKAHELLKKYDINPRDAIHAASAISKNLNIILSDDKDFDKLTELKRKTLD